MWGSIIGDLAGSIYEYQQTKKISKIDNIDSLINEKSFFSDDTILTMAILDAIINNGNYEKYLKDYIFLYNDYKPEVIDYFKTTFSPGLLRWFNDDKKGFSRGNGALMRIAPVGYLFDNENDVMENAFNVTAPSHNSDEAIRCTKIVSLIIFYARKSCSKEEIIDKLKLKITYNDFKKFNTTCDETINNCLYALFTTNSFADSIKTVISYGGDTDTNACIVGGMAEALYGIDTSIIDNAMKKIPTEFVHILNKGYSRIKKLK